MKIKNKRIVSILTIIMIIGIFIPNIIFAEELPQTLEVKSEIKYGPFATEHREPEVFEGQIRLYSTEMVEVASNLDELKDAVYKNMKNYENSFSINYKGDTSTLKADINNIWDEIFERDDYLYGMVSSYGFKSGGYVNDVTINFTLSYHTTRAQEDFVDYEVRRIVDEIIEPNMTDFQKVKAVNDWVVNNTKYNIDTNTSPYAAYTLFNEGEGVCQAYALATYRLLEEIGIEVKYVTGPAGGGKHGWNLVKVDGKWYHLDTTWNDPVLQDGTDMLSYKYFLISDAAISKDHKKDNKNYPDAIDTRYEVMRGIENPYEYDNKLYYGNADDDIKLYVFDLETMSNTKLIDIRAQYIAVYDGWIYYSNYSNGGYLYKVRTDGTENTRLNEECSIDIYVEYPYLYYTVNGIEIKMPLVEINEDDKYIQWKEQVNIPSNKEWEINFNYPIDKSNLGNRNIYIKDSQGKTINTSLYFVDDKTVSIRPYRNFTSGVYYLYVESVKSITGKELKEDVKMKFIVN